MASRHHRGGSADALSTPLLEVRNLSKAFGGVRAVRELSFRVDAGEVVGLLGPNGSGKTTVFNLVAGTLFPDGGDVLFAGTPITHLPPNGRNARGIARTFQHVRAFGRLSVLNNVAVARLFGASPASGLGEARRDAAALLELVDLLPLQAERVDRLTVAARKRLELARALATRPRLLLLDEPLAGLNTAEVKQSLALLSRIRDEDVTLIVVEHNVDAIHSMCGRVVVLNAGRKIAEGLPDEVLADPQVVEIYLGEPGNAHHETTA